MKETKFKQTEVGMIPSDWEVKFLSEIGSFSKGSGISRSESNSGNLPAIRYGEIYTKHNDYIKAFYSHISKEVANKSTRIYRGDVLFSASGETKEDIGKTVAFLESIEAYAGGDIIIMSPKCPVNSMFLGYILNFPAIAKQKAMKAQGDAVVHITTDSLRKLQVCIPKTTKEQQRIANALSDVDTLIANLEKLIAKKKNIKQGAMQQLLTGKKRLPGFAPDERRKECHSERSAKRETEESSGYKMTELGMIPSDWEVKTFGELFDMCTANIPIKDVNQEFYVGTENMLQNKMGVVKNTAVLPYSKVREYQKNDILVSNIRPYLKKIWFADKNGGCSTDVLVFRVKDKNQSPSFLYNVVADDRFFNTVNENAIGTKMPRGDKNVIKQILFAVPSSKAEQTAIANVLSDMDAEIATLETKLARYRTLKTGMMQQLLTGKIRLI